MNFLGPGVFEFSKNLKSLYLGPRLEFWKTNLRFGIYTPKTTPGRSFSQFGSHEFFGSRGFRIFKNLKSLYLGPRLEFWKTNLRFGIYTPKTTPGRSFSQFGSHEFFGSRGFRIFKNLKSLYLGPRLEFWKTNLRFGIYTPKTTPGRSFSQFGSHEFFGSRGFRIFQKFKIAVSRPSFGILKNQPQIRNLHPENYPWKKFQPIRESWIFWVQGVFEFSKNLKSLYLGPRLEFWKTNLRFGIYTPKTTPGRSFSQFGSHEFFGSRRFSNFQKFKIAVSRPSFGILKNQPQIRNLHPENYPWKKFQPIRESWIFWVQGFSNFPKI